MIIDSVQFIQLTNDHSYSILNGQPLYIDTRKISVIRPKTDVNGNKKGSYVHIDGRLEGDVLMVKESPEDIIRLINDGSFCDFSNKFPYLEK